MFNSFFIPEIIKSRNTLPACDSYETDKHYRLSMNLPGIPKENIAMLFKQLCGLAS